MEHDQFWFAKIMLLKTKKLKVESKKKSKIQFLLKISLKFSMKTSKSQIDILHVYVTLDEKY